MNSEAMDGNWRDKAECVKTDPELFFPTGESSAQDRQQISDAKAFCVRCLVKDQCLEYAMETRQDDGVWGEMTAKERLALRRRGSLARRGLL